jgi:hypothetical protein
MIPVATQQFSLSGNVGQQFPPPLAASGKF